MIKGISYWSMPDGLSNTHPIPDAIQRALAADFEGIELCIAPEGIIHTGLDERACGESRGQLDLAGLHCSTLASGMSWTQSPTSEDAATRERAIALHADALRRAAWLGCEALLFVPGVVNSPLTPDEHIRYDLAVDRARVAVGRLLEVAEAVGVDLCLENVWNGLFYSPLELRDFVDSFSSPRLGVYFDCGNVLGYHQRPDHWIQVLGKRIKRVHVKGYRETFGFTGSYEFCGLLEGDVPWAPTMSALKEVGYAKTIVAEMLPYREGLLEQVSAELDTILAM